MALWAISIFILMVVPVWMIRIFTEGYLPNGGVIHWAKWLTALVFLIFWKKKQQKVFDYDPKSKNLKSAGIVASEREWKYELPRHLDSDENSSDTIFMSGMDPKGNCLVIRICRRTGRRCELWLQLRLASGQIYQLPRHPDTTVYNTSGKSFHALGLYVDVVEPMRMWKINFNGLLRKGIRERWDNNIGKIVHVRFNFVWHPMHCWYDERHDFSMTHMSDVLAEAPWSFWKSWKTLELFQLRDAYEQWGQFHGLLEIEGKTPEELFLWGPKIREYGKLDWASIHLSLNVFGYSENGCAFHIWSSCSDTFDQNAVHGYVIRPNGVLAQLTQCSQKLFDLTHNNRLRNPVEISFQSGSQYYRITIPVLKMDSIRLYLGSNWESQVTFKIGKIALQKETCQGVLIFTRRDLDGSPIPVKQSIPHIETQVETDSTSGFVVNLQEPDSDNPHVVGRKASTLALLSKLAMCNTQFVIPKSVVVTTVAFAQFLQDNEDIHDLINNMCSTACGKSDGSTKDICSKIVRMILNAEVSQDLLAELDIILFTEFGKDFNERSYAVRSSEFSEASEEVLRSCRFEAILGCKGMKMICKAILQCWSSAFLYRSIEYKRQHGQALIGSMGVLIQEMVPATSAGVLFTQDPLTGNVGFMTIAANYGLGESVSSGSTDPDTVILCRNWDDSIKIHETEAGVKGFQYILNVDGQVEENFLDPTVSSSFSLSEESALALGEIGIKLENYFGVPQDIEWAMCRGKIYLLQCRPVTIHNMESEFQLLHEFDSALTTNWERLVRANAGDGMSNAVSPASLSSVWRIIGNKSQYHFRLKRNCKYDPIDPNYLFTFFSCLFLNRMNTKKTCKLWHQQTLELTTFGSIIGDLDIHDFAIEQFGLQERKGLFQRIGVFLKCILQYGNDNIIKNAMKKFDNYVVAKNIHDRMTACELFDQIMQSLLDIGNILEAHLKNTSNSMLINLSVLDLLTGGREPSLENYSDLANILKTKDIEISRLPTKMHNLAKTIIKTGIAKRFLELTPKAALKFLQDDNSLPGVEFRDFVKLYGHRGVQEYDLMSISWGMAPLYLVKLLQSLIRSCQNSAYCRDQGDQNASNLVIFPQKSKPFNSRVGIIDKLLLPMIITTCQKTLKNRETTKSLIIKTIDGFRIAFRRLAALMVREGRIPDEDLLFFFTLGETEMLLQTRSGRLVIKAQRRRRLHSYCNSLEFSEVVAGFPTPVEITLSEDAVDKDGYLRAHGYPVFEGLVKGIARVITDIEDTNDIHQGEILITRAADVSWTPFYPILGGIVTEYGGLVSHGAIVAKEYGLPCVVGVRNATATFKTGDLVRLDAGRGILERLAV